MISIVTTAKPLGAAASACRHRFTMTTRASCGAREARAAPNPATAAQPPRKSAIHTFGTGFRGHPAKYRHDDRPRHPCRHSVGQFPDRSYPLVGASEGRPGDWWAKATARRADSRAACACRDRLRRLLVEHGHHRFLHHLEPDPNGGWRLHIFAANNAALALLDEVAEGECGPGDPVKFDPNEFVSARLRHLVANDTNSS